MVTMTLTVPLAGGDLLDGAFEVLERPFLDPDGLAAGEADLDLGGGLLRVRTSPRIFSTSRFDMGIGLLPSPRKSPMPGVSRIVNQAFSGIFVVLAGFDLDHDVAGIDLAFADALLAAADFRDPLAGHQDAADQLSRPSARTRRSSASRTWSSLPLCTRTTIPVLRHRGNNSELDSILD